MYPWSSHCLHLGQWASPSPFSSLAKSPSFQERDCHLWEAHPAHLSLLGHLHCSSSLGLKIPHAAAQCFPMGLRSGLQSSCPKLQQNTAAPRGSHPTSTLLAGGPRSEFEPDSAQGTSHTGLPHTKALLKGALGDTWDCHCSLFSYTLLP